MLDPEAFAAELDLVYEEAEYSSINLKSLFNDYGLKC